MRTWVNNLPENQGRGNMNYGRGASWQEFSDGVSLQQVTAWLKANPNLTPTEIFANMKSYKITMLTIANAKITPGVGGIPYQETLRAFNMATPAVTTKMLYDAGVIQVNPSGMARGGFGSTDGVFNGDNVYHAAAAGWINKGVMYADKYGIPPVSGKTSEDVSFSQKDLDEAKRYRSTGYWGPSESGDMDIEFRKKGLVTGEGLNTKYTYPGGMWSNDTPTGPNIADPAVYKYIPQGSTSSGVIVTSTGTTATTTATGMIISGGSTGVGVTETGGRLTLMPLNCFDHTVVNTWYKEYLGRCGDEKGLAFWNQRLLSRMYSSDSVYTQFKAAVDESLNGKTKKEMLDSILCSPNYTYRTNSQYCMPVASAAISTGTATGSNTIVTMTGAVVTTTTSSGITATTGNT